MKHREVYFHVSTGCDDVFAPHATVMIESLLSNCSTPDRICIHFLSFGLCDESIKKIQYTVDKHKAKIVFHIVPHQWTNTLVSTMHLTMNTYLRLYVADVLDDDIARVLYLDSDTIVFSDVITHFERIDIEKYALAAVYDISVSTKLKEKWRRPRKYFNAGVMYINTKLWREKKFKDTSHVYACPDTDLYSDQDLLNRVFKDNWKLLPVVYNYPDCHDTSISFFGYFEIFGMKNLVHARMSPHVVHFLGRVKAWNRFPISRFVRAYRKHLYNTLWEVSSVLNVTPISVKILTFIKNAYHTYLPYSLRTKLGMKKYISRTWQAKLGIIDE